MTRKKQPPEVSLVRSSAAEYLTFVAASGTGGVEALYADENVWLSQKMMAQLYDVEVPTINYHLKKVFEDTCGAGLRVLPHPRERALHALLPLGLAAHHPALGDGVPTPEGQGRRAPPARREGHRAHLTLKRENPAWGQRRIKEELRRMGISVSEPTIARVLKEHGFAPRPGRELDFERVTSSVKDAVWALDFFAVKTAKGVWLQALLIIDIHTREIIDLRVYDGWDVDSTWTLVQFVEACAREKRRPKAVVHDHGAHFAGRFERQMRGLEIDNELTPPYLPIMNCYAERAIGSIRRELLRHVRVADAKELQWYCDQWREYQNQHRPHQGIDGRTPEERSKDAPLAEVIDLDAVRRRKLQRREYAHGLLRGYVLTEDAPTTKAA
ncbi:MAG: integrase core domain-containing protein [Kofleriaceae bacterium]